MGKRRMTASRIAKIVVEELFTSGAGQHAERLVLTSATGQDLGGWGKDSVRRMVTKIIQAAIPVEGKPMPTG